MEPSVENDQTRAERRLGHIVGRYRLERVLGVGGMAAVYVGRSQEGFVAAVKILHDDMSVRRDVRERFYREGYVANSVQHPGVVRVLEHGESGPDAFLAMELLSGETLSDRVKRLQTLSVHEVLSIADQVLDTLRAAHEKGIVHRDLKPDNLFITHAGQMKILDFGLARLAEAAPGDQRTRSGVALGTLPYMAPEQALGRRDEIDGRTDLFALGATLFRLLAGRRLHEAPSEAELLIAMATRTAPPLISVAPHLPIDVCRIVDLSLAFSREGRYPSAEVMQNDVRAVAIGQHPPFAFARLAHRDEKTRMDAAAAPSAPGSLRGPQGTVPLAAHANLGMTLGGHAAPNQLAQTYPSAVTPHLLTRTVPSAGVSAEAQVAVVSAPPAPPLGQTMGPSVQAASSSPQGWAPPSASGSHGAHALGQTYPSAGQGEAVRSPASLGQTFPSASPVEVVVQRASSAADLAQTFPSAGAMPQAGPAAGVAYPAPGAQPQAPFAPPSHQPNPFAVPQAAPVLNEGSAPAAYGQAVPATAPPPVQVVAARAPAKTYKHGTPLLWVLAVLGLLVSAGVGVAVLMFLRARSANAPTPRTSSSSLAAPAGLDAPVTPLTTSVASASAAELERAPASTAPVVELAPTAAPLPTPSAKASAPVKRPSAPSGMSTASNPSQGATPAVAPKAPRAPSTVPMSELK